MVVHKGIFSSLYSRVCMFPEVRAVQEVSQHLCFLHIKNINVYSFSICFL